MKCWHHPDTDAVGVCRYCGRGLCPACAAPKLRWLACHHRCEVMVRAQYADLIAKVERQATARRMVLSPRARAIWRGVGYGLLAAALLAGNIYFHWRGRLLLDVGLLGSAGIVLAAIAGYRYLVRRWGL